MAPAAIVVDAGGSEWLDVTGTRVALGDRMTVGVDSLGWAALTGRPTVAHPLVDGDASELTRRRVREVTWRRAPPSTKVGTIVAGTSIAAMAAIPALLDASERMVAGGTAAVTLGGLLFGGIAVAWPSKLMAPSWQREAESMVGPELEVSAWWSLGLHHAVEPWVTVAVPGSLPLSWPLAGDVTELHGHQTESEVSAWTTLGITSAGERIGLRRGDTTLWPSQPARADVVGPPRASDLAWPEAL